MKKLLSLVLCLVLCLGILAVTASAATTYYVAGYPGLCGSEWNCADPNNAMTPNGDGTHSITYKDVPAGYYEFKVTNGTWDSCWPGSNYGLNLDKTCDVTIHFNESTTEITVDASAQVENPPLVIVSVSVIGEQLDELAANGAWATDVAMTETSTGVYEYTFKNVSGECWPTFKFRVNNDWSVNFGSVNDDGAVSGAVNEGVQDGKNIWLHITELSDIHMKLDLSKFDSETKTGATYTITVTPVTTEVTPDPDPEPTPDPEPEEMVTVHAKVPADWSTVCAYVWDGKGTDNSWPGYTMTLGNDGWYSVEVPAWAANVIIDNGGNGAQTQDIAINAGKDVWVVVEASGDGFVGTLTYSVPATGDSANLVAACAAMLLAGAGVVAMVAKKKEF